MISAWPRQPEVSDKTYSVVFLGNFNPIIYQPAWFAAQGLLRESEAENARVEIIHANGTSFATDWFVIQVTPEKFILQINSSAYQVHLLDLVLGTFRTLLHTPLTQMGINCHAVIRFKSARDQHNFGRFLLPSSHWNGLLSKPDMHSITVKGARLDDLPGFVTVKAVVQEVEHETVIGVNDHCACPPDQQSNGADFFLKIVEKDYDQTISRAEDLVDGILARFCEQSTWNNGDAE